MQNKLIYFTMIFISLVLITGVSVATDERIVKNGTGEINVITSFSENPGLSVPHNDASFTISGPETYSENESYWTKPDAPAGTYTIKYGPVSKYKTPPSETKTLTAGDSITFSGYYTLKKRIGERLDFGDGYVVLIKQIDPKKKEVLMQFQLDELIIDKKIVKENGSYILTKYGEETGTSITPMHISLDARGKYTGIFIESLVGAPTPGAFLTVISKPEGADVTLIGEKYMGKTINIPLKKTPIDIPVDDLKKHFIRVELKGNRWEGEYKLESLTEPKEMKVTFGKPNRMVIRPLKN